MATKKVIDMSTRAAGANHDDYVYLTAASPDTDERWPAAYLRQFILDGITGGYGIDAVPAGNPAAANTTVDLVLDVSELTAAAGTADVTDYVVIEAASDNSTKKILIGSLPFVTAAVSDVASLSSNLTASPTTGNVKIDLATTLTGLTSVTSTGFTGALTGNADTATTAATVTDATQAAITSAANLVTVGTIGTGVWEGTDIAAGYLADTAVTPGSYTHASLTIDQQGRITAASSGSPGDLTAVLAGTGITVTDSTGPEPTVELTSPVTVATGGTGQTSYTNGQLLIGNTTGSTLAKSTLTAGSNVTITNGTGTIEIAATDTNTTYTAGDGLDLTGTTFSTDLMANGGLEITTTELSVAQGISQYDVAQFDTGVVDDDFLRINGTAVEGRSASEVKTDIGLGNVENTALSTWTGSTNVTTLGTIATGTWEGTTVAVDQGGTGQTSYTNGQLLIGNTTGNTLTKATLTAGTNITITEGAGSITIAAAAGGDPAGTAVAMAIALGG